MRRRGAKHGACRRCHRLHRRTGNTPVDTPICRGKANFHDRTLAGLGGNGRACSDCHMDTENFQLTPVAAQQRFAQMTMTGTDDPLFRPIDADDFRVNGAAAHDFTNLTQNGLVRVTLPLPANVKLLDCGSKGPVPGVRSPDQRDRSRRLARRPFDPRLQHHGSRWCRSSIARAEPKRRLPARWPHRHATEPSAERASQPCRNAERPPPAPGRSRRRASKNAQFSSPSVKALSDAIAARRRPAAGSRSCSGRAGGCGQGCLRSVVRPVPRQHRWCHPSGSTPIEQGTPGTPTALIRYHSIQSACPRPVDTVNPPRFVFAACSASQMENVRTYEITNSGAPPSGTPCGGAPPQAACVTRVTISDPGRMLLTGYPVPGGPGDIQHFDNPSLRGIARTAPYFHNNTAATLEDVLEHYKQFFKFVAIQQPAAPLLTTKPGVVPPVHDRPFTDAEIPALLAYLRKL